MIWAGIFSYQFKTVFDPKKLSVRSVEDHLKIQLKLFSLKEVKYGEDAMTKEEYHDWFVEFDSIDHNGKVSFVGKGKGSSLLKKCLIMCLTGVGFV